MPGRVFFFVVAVLVVLLGVQTVRVGRLQEQLAVQRAVSGPGLARTDAPKSIDAGKSARNAVQAKIDPKKQAKQDVSIWTDDAEAENSPQKEANKLVKALEAIAEAPVASAAERERGRKASDKASADKKASDAKKAAQAVARKVRDLVEAGDFDGAASMLRDEIAKGNGSGQVYSTLASLYRKMGMQDEEMQLYRDWMTNLPADPNAHYALASAYERNGMNAEALRELAQYEQMSNGQVSSYAQAASLYGRLGDRANQGRILQEWSSQVPGSPDARLAMAQYYMQTGNYGAAVGEYQAATQILPGNVQAHVGLARAYQQGGDYASAQAELNAAVGIRPEDMGIRLQLADMYRRGGDPALAVQVYQDVINQQPDSQEARRAAQAIRRIQTQVPRTPKVRG
jgi:tetratricopeptide (TPR) repeat protein